MKGGLPCRVMTKLSSSPMTTAQRIAAPAFLPGEPQSFTRKLSYRDPALHSSELKGFRAHYLLGSDPIMRQRESL